VSYTLADLLSPESTATIRARLVAALVAAGAPVDSWAPADAGGMENLRLDVVAETTKQFCRAGSPNSRAMASSKRLPATD
jgi:hypothetical protein